MKKNYLGFLLFLVLSAAFWASCSSNIPDEPEVPVQEEEQEISSEIKEYLLENNKGYLVIDSVNMNTSRSINPTSDEEVLNSFTSLNLSATGKDASNKTLYFSSISAGSISELYKKQILIDAGTWTFTLTAEIPNSQLGKTTFTSTVSDVLIEAGKDNSVSFNLEQSGTNKGYGSLSVKLYLDKNYNKNNLDKVIINLYQTDDDDDDSNDVLVEDDYSPKTITSSSFSWDGTTRTYYVPYTRAISGNGKIPVGEYRLVFDFYFGSQILNSFSFIVHIAEGITTTYEQTIDLNEVFKITYEGKSASPTAYIANGQTLVEKYSRKSEDIILPGYNRQDRLFGGWWTTSDETGEIVTKIPHNSNKNITLYAHWINLTSGDPVTIYVNPEAEGHYGFSEEYGLASLEAAMETIEKANCYIQNHDWIIKIKGELSGSHVITSDVSNVKTHVKSITLEGITDSGATPTQACLNGGYTTATEDAAVLSVQFPNPVIIKNLKITGGNNNNSGNIKGGGIYVADGSTVILDDGTLITGNSAAAGAGIYNEGTLKIKGSAVVQASGTGANDVYLPDGKKVVIAGSLTGSGKVAKITPATYSTGTAVLEAESGSDVTLSSAIANKFNVTAQVTGSDTTYWAIDEDGKLCAGEAPVINSNVSMVIENAADIQLSFTCATTTITKNVETEITITPQAELNSDVPLYILDDYIYTAKSYSADNLISDDPIYWNITLWCEDEQITGTNYISSTGNTVTLNIPYPGNYVIKATANYLGIAHDAEFQITCQ